MCDPVSIGLGVLSAGLGIMQARAAADARRQQVDYQNTVTRRQYEVDVLRADLARDAEQEKKEVRDRQIERNEMLARAAEARKLTAARLAYKDKQLQTAKQKREAALEAQRAKGSLLAAGRQGAVVQTLVADVNRQLGQFNFFSDRNLAFAGTKAQQIGRDAAIERIGRIFSISPYTPRTVLDPYEPVYQSDPGGATFMDYGNAVFGGVQTGLGIGGQINNAGFEYKDGGYRRIE
jgi:hypothetical protein